MFLVSSSWAHYEKPTGDLLQLLQSLYPNAYNTVIDNGSINPDLYKDYYDYAAIALCKDFPDGSQQEQACMNRHLDLLIGVNDLLKGDAKYVQNAELKVCNNKDKYPREMSVLLDDIVTQEECEDAFFLYHMKGMDKIQMAGLAACIGFGGDGVDKSGKKEKRSCINDVMNGRDPTGHAGEVCLEEFPREWDGLISMSPKKACEELKQSGPDCEAKYSKYITNEESGSFYVKGARESCYTEVAKNQPSYHDIGLCKQFEKGTPEHDQCKKSVNQNAWNATMGVPACGHLKTKAECNNTYPDGTSENASCKKEYGACVAQEFARNLAKSIGTELAKDGGPIGKIAAMGLSVSSCIPRGAFNKEHGNQYSVPPDVPPAKADQILEKGMKRCGDLNSKYQRDQCLRLVATNCLHLDGRDYTSCTTKQKVAAQEYWENGTNTDVTLGQEDGRELGSERTMNGQALESGLCVAGAALDIFAMDNPEIAKYGKAGLAAINCLRMGPEGKKPAPGEDGYQQWVDRSSARASCLLDTAGGMVDNKYASAAFTAAAKTADCMKFKPNLATGEEKKRLQREKATCLASAALMGASQAIGEDNKKAAMIIDIAGRAVNCAALTGAEARNCLATQALMSGAEYIKDPRLAEALNIGAQALQTFGKGGAVQACLQSSATESQMDRGACIAQGLTGFLPGDSGTYLSFLLQARGIVKTGKKAGCASSKIMAAGSFVGLTGGLVSMIVQKYQTKKLEEHMSKQEEKQKQKEQISGDENGEVSLQEQTAHLANALDRDIQVMAYDYQIMSEKYALQSMKINNTFTAISSGLNTVGATIAAFELLGSFGTGCTEAGALRSAFDKECLGGGDGLKDKNFMNAFKEFRSVSEFDYYKDIEKEKDYFFYLQQSQSDLEAIALHMEYHQFITNPYGQSISVDHYGRMKEAIADLDFEMAVKEVLLVASNMSIMNEAYALDLPPEALELMLTNAVSMTWSGNKMASGLGIPNSPMAFAEQMVARGIEKAMMKANGGEYFKGKHAITLVAQKLSSFLLNKSSCVITAAMSTTWGRIAIAGFNVYTFVKLIQDMKKATNAQKKKIAEVKQLRQDYIDGKTFDVETKENQSFYKPLNDLYHKKVKDISNHFISNAYAAPKEPGFKFCMGRNMRIDASCNCAKKKNGCYTPFGKHHSQHKGMQALMKQNKKMFVPAAQVTGFYSKLVSDVFSGSQSIEDVDIKKVEALNAKMNKMNEKLLKAANNMLKTKNKRPFNVKRTNKIFDGLIRTSFDKKTWASLNKINSSDLARTMPYNIPNLDGTGPQIKAYASSDGAIKNRARKGFPTRDDMTASDFEAPQYEVENAQRTIADAEQKVQKKKEKVRYIYDENVNDIHEKERDIFKIISLRHQKSIKKISN
jgi:hypothetical protein